MAPMENHVVVVGTGGLLVPTMLTQFVACFVDHIFTGFGHALVGMKNMFSLYWPVE